MYVLLQLYYPFLRLFYTIYERIRFASKILEDKVEEKYHHNRDHVVKMYEQLQGKAPESAEECKKLVSKELYCILASITITKLKGSIDGPHFEDMIRSVLGSRSYFYFTFDKLLSMTSKALQHLNGDELSSEDHFDLFKYYKARPNIHESTYQAAFRQTLIDNN